MNRLPILTLAAASLAFAPAQAIECVSYGSDADMVAHHVENLRYVSVVLSGVIVKEGNGEGSIGIIKPEKIWFGPRQSEYHFKQGGMEDLGATLSSADSGRPIALYLIPPSRRSLVDRVKAWFGFYTPLYGTGGICDYGFGEAMESPEMLAAVRRRAIQERQRSHAGSR